MINAWLWTFIFLPFLIGCGKKEDTTDGATPPVRHIPETTESLIQPPTEAGQNQRGNRKAHQTIWTSFFRIEETVGIFPYL